ncbi:MAG: glycosyltransferase [Saprospiraceae bacterium]|nr:glycosyltransferase [Saprospiraceae bacterium]
MKISVITTTYNSEETLADTLNCISKQVHPDIEHIVVDGHSKDGTLKIVDQYAHVAHCISEPDDGIYDAMNKGIKRCTGDVIGILNSDDIYASSDILVKVASIFSDNQVDCLYGDLDFVSWDQLDKVVRHWKAGDYDPRKWYRGWMPPHPTFFVRKEIYNRLGLFNLHFKSSADYELMLRYLLKNHLQVYYLPEVMIKMRYGGHSTGSLINRIIANKEDKLAWVINDLKPPIGLRLLKPVRKIGQYRLRPLFRSNPQKGF